MTDKNYEVLVVGGGAAGLNGALVLARARRRVLVVDAGEPRNAPAEGVHGFLSREGTPPADLLEHGRQEVRGYGGEVTTGSVATAERSEAGFTVTLDDGRAFTARRLLVTTGITDELPDLPGLAGRWGRDVLHCPYCHGYEVRDQPLGVLATGPMGMHQALLIRQWSADLVYFDNTADGLAEADRERLTAQGIRIADGPAAEVVTAEDRLAGVRLADGTLVRRAALFVGPRFVANDRLLTQLGVATEPHPMGTFVAADQMGRTSAPGVWAAGNVTDLAAQVISAAAGGARAAMGINADLVEQDS